MAGEVTVRVNDAQLKIALKNFSERIKPTALLKVAGELMRTSVNTTFDEQGSPAGSWPPLKFATLGGMKSFNKTLGKSIKGKPQTARKILIQSGRLKNSITYNAIEGNVLTIGTNVVNAAVHQYGGEAGRKGPFKKKNGHRAFIPARPYLVFRPEDQARITEGMQRVVDIAAKETGL